DRYAGEGNSAGIYHGSSNLPHFLGGCGYAGPATKKSQQYMGNVLFPFHKTWFRLENRERKSFLYNFPFITRDRPYPSGIYLFPLAGSFPSQFLDLKVRK